MCLFITHNLINDDYILSATDCWAIIGSLWKPLRNGKVHTPSMSDRNQAGFWAANYFTTDGHFLTNGITRREFLCLVQRWTTNSHLLCNALTNIFYCLGSLFVYPTIDLILNNANQNALKIVFLSSGVLHVVARTRHMFYVMFTFWISSRLKNICTCSSKGSLNLS